MRHWLIGLAVGIAVGSTAYGETPVVRLGETQITMPNNAPFALPPEYGRLVSVAVQSEVQYLYFEGADGAVRIVLVGPRGSIQRARNVLQLLTPEVYLMKRGRDNEPLPRRSTGSTAEPER
ncbi:MAG: hypothetical protein HYY90_03675 [Candidatus Omnitrophica bacterium]|nr:hypothetical protein [Candidatus Omnitrophota bacterium]MBI3083441.1 hypothetical protein [Candidatus Omnitrophota bacterium]